MPSHSGYTWSVTADVETLAWDPHTEHSFVVRYCYFSGLCIYFLFFKSIKHTSFFIFGKRIANKVKELLTILLAIPLFYYYLMLFLSDESSFLISWIRSC